MVKARELNYTKIHLKVLTNPFDSFYVRTNVVPESILIKGQSIDTTIILRHLPNQQNIIYYYTQSSRDTAGLAALNSNPNGHMYSTTRLISDTISANMADTLYLNKTISNILSIPRE